MWSESVSSTILLLPYPDFCSYSQRGSVASLAPHSFSFDGSLPVHPRPEARWKHDPSSLCQTSAEEWVSGTTLLPAAGSVLIGSETLYLWNMAADGNEGREGLFLKKGPSRQALQVASPRFKQSSSTLQFSLSRRVSAKEGTRHASHNEPHSCCHRF